MTQGQEVGGKQGASSSSGRRSAVQPGRDKELHFCPPNHAPSPTRVQGQQVRAHGRGAGRKLRPGCSPFIPRTHWQAAGGARACGNLSSSSDLLKAQLEPCRAHPPPGLRTRAPGPGSQPPARHWGRPPHFPLLPSPATSSPNAHWTAQNSANSSLAPGALGKAGAQWTP